MQNGKKEFSDDLVNILNKAIKDKIYGSVEIYFEAGIITQITQRTIKKVAHSKAKKQAIFAKSPAKPIAKTDLPTSSGSF